jgi:hypothetical protein
MKSFMIPKILSMKRKSNVLMFLFFLFSLLINFTIAEEECGFEKYKLKTFHKFEEEEKSLRILQNQQYEPIRIVVDYTTLESQSSLSDQLKSKIKQVVESAKSVIQNIIKVKRLTQKIMISRCNTNISIADEIKNGGVNADLIIFPFVDTDMQGTTQAYASTCVISTRNSRPIAGFIGFTKNLNFQKNNWLDYFTNIAVHELTHVLGFNSDIFEAFVDENDKPIPIQNTLQEIEVEGLKRKIIVSPKALEAARKHFNCPDLKGIELENQGGQGTLGSHWESRVMLTDYMIGFTYDETALSEITLAFLEDTGWYKTNYYTGGLFRYGKNAGCSFTNDKCIIDEKVLFKNEFCDNRNAPFCSAGKINKGFCYINDYSTNLDPNYQYFKALNEGGLTFTDYCPVSAVPTNTDSFLPWNCMTGIKGQYPEEFGELISTNSACFMSSLISKQFESMFNSVSTKAICYQYSCNFDTKKYNITIGKNMFECPSKGGFVEVEDYSGVFECPPFYLICTSETRCFNLADCVMKKALPVEYSIDNSISTDENTSNDGKVPITPVDLNNGTNSDAVFTYLNKFIFLVLLFLLH